MRTQGQQQIQTTLRSNGNFQQRGLNITIIGKMGTGKTTFIKNFLRGRKCYIFDVNNEYPFLPIDIRAPQCRDIELDKKHFIARCLNKRNTVCVFEDATGFIEGRLDETFRKCLVKKRHTGNIHILVFHSICAMPPKLKQLSDYIILFRTSDEWDEIKVKYKSLLEDYDSVNFKSGNDPFVYRTIKV